MTELKHACHCVYKIRDHVVFCIKTKLQSDGTSCPAALLRLGVPEQRLTAYQEYEILAKYKEKKAKGSRFHKKQHSKKTYSLSELPKKTVLDKGARDRLYHSNGIARTKCP